MGSARPHIIIGDKERVDLALHGRVPGDPTKLRARVAVAVQALRASVETALDWATLSGFARALGALEKGAADPASLRFEHGGSIEVARAPEAGAFVVTFRLSGAPHPGLAGAGRYDWAASGRFECRIAALGAARGECEMVLWGPEP